MLCTLSVGAVTTGLPLGDCCSAALSCTSGLRYGVIGGRQREGRVGAPVQALRDCDEVDTAVWQSHVFRCGHLEPWYKAGLRVVQLAALTAP